ncbi:MAG: hypothetical protein JNG90_04640 [Planctomycetaceae bacterium]|nr:hypothetical protein [Planctomycetaceae bacterium]
MARPRLRSPEQSFPVRFLLGLYEFAASLRLAVVLLFAAAFVLGWATFVESEYGTRAVQFGIYGAWWFTLLFALLAVNIFAAAAIRYPWKRYQTGFVITHIGLLTLLLGCLLSRRGGIDAQMPIVEGEAGQRAFEDTEHFELTVVPQRAATSAATEATSNKPQDELVEVTHVPFVGGPFNWEDYQHKSPFPWRFAQRDQGLIYDHDGIRLEVLDYYSNSEEVPAPHLRLKLSSPRIPRPGPDGKEVLPPEIWTRHEFSLEDGSHVQPPRPFGLGMRQRVGGGQIVFWLAGSEAERQAFLASAPDSSVGLGERGQVVLHAGGQKHSFLVSEKLGQPAFPLGESGLTAEVVNYYASPAPKPGAAPGRLELIESQNPGGSPNPAVEILLRQGDAEPLRMLLFATMPELNEQAYGLNVFGSYWFDFGGQSSEELLAMKGESRIDIIQGQDEKLYYRYFNRREVPIVAELPRDGTPVDAFKMPIAQLRMKVERLVPATKPERQVLPLAFKKETLPTDAFRAAKVRATVDGNQEEFWLVGLPPAILAPIPSPLSERVVAGQGRSVVIRFPLDEVDVGFKIRLDEFERKLDPGTSQASHFGSQVAFLEPKESLTKQGLARSISMNAPVDFSDPGSGKSYRLFQEAYRGPFPQGSREYQLSMRRSERASTSLPEQVYISILTVNYDPGRGVKAIGCLLVVAGIVTMFYMRAYFFPQKKTTA